MDYLGDKLTVAHTQVTDWVGSMRRSLQGALTFVSNTVDRTRGGEEGSGFKRAASLRSLANRSRESIRRFSVRSRQHLRRRISSTSPQGAPDSVRTEHTVQFTHNTHKGYDDVTNIFYHVSILSSALMLTCSSNHGSLACF